MLKTQEYIINNGLEQLVSNYKLSCNRHKDYPNLIQLKYSQLESPSKGQIVRECRGLILDESNNYSIVCYPFKRFYNHGDIKADRIDWDNAIAYEKLDGSFISMYYYDNAWHISTSSLPDASGILRSTGESFNSLFWKIWDELKYELPTNNNISYIFEVTSPHNEVLVEQTKNNITLIGARNLNSLLELDIETINCNWKKCNTFTVTNENDFIEFSHQLNPMKQEGFVLVDKNFNRVKVKSPQYVKINLLKGNKCEFIDRYLLDIIKINEGDEFLSAFENLRTPYNTLNEKYNNLIFEMEQFYELMKNETDFKKIGLASKDIKFPSMVFQLKNKKYKSVKEFISKIDSKNLLKIL